MQKSRFWTVLHRPETKNEKQIIFIDGEAGTGKTVLNSSIFYELYCQEEEKRQYRNLNAAW